MNNSHYFSKHLRVIEKASTADSKKSWVGWNYQGYLPENKNAAILEIGPGSGELIKWLIELGYTDISAIDISDEVVEHCNTSIGSNVSELVSDTTEYLKRNKSRYDLIFMLHVLEHIPKDKVFETLSSLKDSLNDSGVAIIEVPNIANVIVGNWSFFSDFTHEVPYTDKRLNYVLNVAGFDVIGIYELKVPIVSAKRFVQHSLQKACDFIMRNILRLYLPSETVLVSPSIYAIVRNAAVSADDSTKSS